MWPVWHQDCPGAHQEEGKWDTYLGLWCIRHTEKRPLAQVRLCLYHNAQKSMWPQLKLLGSLSDQEVCQGLWGETCHSKFRLLIAGSIHFSCALCNEHFSPNFRCVPSSSSSLGVLKGRPPHFLILVSFPAASSLLPDKGRWGPAGSW